MSIAEKLTAVAENQQAVYDAGYSAGQHAGGGGGDSYYDTFWDTYQQNGTRTGYAYAFAGMGWRNGNFNPKYDMQPLEAPYMFSGAYINGDFDEALGVTLDFSRCRSVAYLFYQFGNNMGAEQGTETTLGTIDLSSATDVTSVFNGTGIIGIKALVPPPLEMRNTCFQVNLKSLTVTGYFTKSVNLSRCTSLNRASIESVVEHLDANATATATFSQTAVNKVFSAAEWETLASTKPNWQVVAV